MGGCNSTPEEREQRRVNNQINKQLSKEKRNQSVKILLLGTGESGKSTILKQMKILHQKAGPEERVGLTKEDREQQVPIIRSNVITAIEILLDVATEMFHYSLAAESKESEKRVRDVLEMEDHERMTQYNNILQDIITLYQDPSIQKCLEHKNQFYLLDSAPYFLKKASTIGEVDYLPSDEDVLRARSQTTGVTSMDFMLKEGSTELKLELVDVGGQRGERRRWIHCFEGVDAVMFIISLSDYNQTLWEDETTNRMLEAEKLFGEMLNNVFFRETPFIVFFNKLDLFKEKFRKVSLAEAYKEYSPPKEVKTDGAREEHALNFIQHRFKSQDKTKNREITTFETTATDTDLVRNVLDTVKRNILKAIMKDFGFTNS